MNKKGTGGIILVVLLVLVGIYAEVVGIHYVTLNNGSHTGTITAVETSGIIFKTTTVYVKTDAQSSQEDSYCLIDESMIPLLKEQEMNKTKVTVKYINYLFKGLMYCDGEPGGIIVGVE